MRQFVFLLLAGVVSAGLLPPTVAQKFEDETSGQKKKGEQPPAIIEGVVRPGGTSLKQGNGYTPDPKARMYVILWHHKKRTNEFGGVYYYMNADGVNDTTAKKMVKLIQERYPNLAVYDKETNEVEIKTLVEREKKRVKFIVKDWVDVKQPDKIEPPSKVGDKRYAYDEKAKKETAPGKLEGTIWVGTQTDGVRVVIRFEKDGKMSMSLPDSRNKEFYSSNKVWKRDGDSVEFANVWNRFSGKIKGDTIEGRNEELMPNSGHPSGKETYKRKE